MKRSSISFLVSLRTRNCPLSQPGHGEGCCALDALAVWKANKFSVV